MSQILNKLNWYEILYAAVGAFLGFFLAYLAEKKIDKHKRRQTIENIVSELLNIQVVVEKRILQSASSDLIARIKNGIAIEALNEQDCSAIKSFHGMKHSICTPIWDTIVSSGILLDFKDENYFDELIQVYSRVHRISSVINSVELNGTLYVGIVKDGIYIDSVVSLTAESNLAKEIAKWRK